MTGPSGVAVAPRLDSVAGQGIEAFASVLPKARRGAPVDAFGRLGCVTDLVPDGSTARVRERSAVVAFAGCGATVDVVGWLGFVAGEVGA